MLHLACKHKQHCNTVSIKDVLDKHKEQYLHKNKRERERASHFDFSERFVTLKTFVWKHFFLSMYMSVVKGSILHIILMENKSLIKICVVLGTTLSGNSIWVGIVFVYSFALSAFVVDVDEIMSRLCRVEHKPLPRKWWFCFYEVRGLNTNRHTWRQQTAYMVICSSHESPKHVISFNGPRGSH